MGEKKKLFFVILTGIAGLFFLSTNLFIPIYKDNSKRLNDYKKLNSEVKIIDSRTEELSSTTRIVDYKL